MKLENIKFKAKRIDNKKWVYGSLIRSATGIKERAYIVDNFSSMSDYSVIGIDPSTICQFTGAKDANGTDLYENDIIHFKGYKPIGIIKWVDDVYAFMVEYDGNLDYLSNVLDVGKVERLGSTQDKEDNSYED